jgi:hypothetical protein
MSGMRLFRQSTLLSQRRKQVSSTFFACQPETRTPEAAAAAAAAALPDSDRAGRGTARLCRTPTEPVQHPLSTIITEFSIAGGTVAH